MQHKRVSNEGLENFQDWEENLLVKNQKKKLKPENLFINFG